MQFFKDGPDIPERLLEAHEEGEVVFFCGAGISYPAGLPGFEGLVDELYGRLAPVPDEEQKAARNAKQFDTAIALLEEKHVGGREQVRETLNKILRPRTTDPKATATHKALLTLSENREGRRRLITTNFDRLFQTVMRRDKLRVTIFQAPLLPVPKTRWNGLVYLHGLLAARPDADNLNSLVLSSGDFGLAYLTERWAARFVSDLFHNFTVCFVGYSIGDPVLRYMMDALAADRQLGESPRKMFAFGSYTKGDHSGETNRWKAKNVSPILYLEDSDHTRLHRTLGEWAKTYGDGVSGKEHIVVHGALARPVTSTKEDDFVTRVLWALSDRRGLPAKRFAEMNPVPSLEWLEPLSEQRFGRDRLAGFDVEPETAVDEKFRFSLTHRPAPYTLAPWMGLTDVGPRWSRWDNVMAHLARWLTRHLNDPALVLWLVDGGAQVHEWFAREVADRIEYIARLESEGNTTELDNIKANAPNAIPSPLMRTLWRLLLTGRVQWRGLDLALYDWRKRFSRDGLTTTLRLELCEKLAPQVSLSKPFPRLIEGDEESEPQRMRDIVEWEIVLSTKYVHTVLGELPDDEQWRRALPELLQNFSGLLRDALGLMRELGEVDDKTDLSYIHQPSITEHPQNKGFHDWTALIDLTRDAWRATAAQSPDRARLAAEGWWHVPYPLFRRLAFFAAAQREFIPARLGLDWLLADKCWWLWSVETTREALRLLVALTPDLDDSERLELESAVLNGPPREMYREDIDQDLWNRVRDRDIWLRLTRMAKASGGLSPAGDERLTELSGTYPDWKLAEDERDEFPHWMGDFGEIRASVTSPREPSELLEWLKEDHTSEFWEVDDWREHCREDFPTTAGALKTLAGRGVWPAPRWSTALHAWSEKDLIGPAWQEIGPVLETAPKELVKEVDHALSWWLREIAGSFEGREATFFSLCLQVLRLDHEVEEQTDDVVDRAINHPVGHVTDALVRWWYRRKLEDEQGLPDELKAIITELCDVSIRAYRHGRVLLAARVVALFRVDRDWTTRHLLPLFDWKNSGPEARAAWDGALGSPLLYPPLMERLKSAFLETANHYAALGRHGRLYAAVLLHASLDPWDVFDNEELARATRGLPQEGVKAAVAALAGAIDGAGDQRADYWKNRVEPYLTKIFPNIQDSVSPAISEKFGHVCISAGNAFPGALRQLREWLQSVKYPEHLVHRLHEAGLCGRFPKQALEFLDLTIEDGPQYPPSDLRECLRAIRSADPKLESDRPFRRLRDYHRKFGIELD